MPEGRESPDPKTQSGRQLQDPPASGKGIENAENKGDAMNSELKNLESNPTAPMDKVLDDKFSKSQK